MITFMTFAQDLMKGRRVFNKHTGRVYNQWEAYYLTRNIITDILDGVNPFFGVQDASGWKDGKYLFDF